jgi:CheY-like chemotaxis protein
LVVAARPRILVADDDIHVRRGLSLQLRRPFDIEEASDGADVIVRIEAGETFDALLLDLEMPNLDGAKLSNGSPSSHRRWPRGPWSSRAAPVTPRFGNG